MIAPTIPSRSLDPVAQVPTSGARCPANPASCCPLTAPIPWLRLAIGIFVAAQTMTFGLAVNLTPPDDPATRLWLYGGMAAATLVVMLLLGWPLAREAAAELFRLRVTMELLFLAGISAALGISIQSMFSDSGPVYFEVVNVLLIVYSVGHAINAGSRQRALSAMQSLTAPISTARLISVLRENGFATEIVPVEAIHAGDRIQVMPGEVIPVDGQVVDGKAMVRQTPFTGEWVSTVRSPGELVMAGTGCEDGSLIIEATSGGGQRRVDRLAHLIESARQSPTSLQRQADGLVRWFLPVVLLLCTATLVFWVHRANWHAALFNALAVLLVACPCAAGLATPLALWSAMGRLASRGLIVHSGDAIERLGQVDGVIFDKTGTLADERLGIRSIATSTDPVERGRVLAAIAAIEQNSEHPVAKVLRDMPCPADVPAARVLSLTILPGRGVEAVVQMGLQSFTVRILRDDMASAGHLRLRVTMDGREAATIILVEKLRDSAALAVARLGELGLAVRVMTGDSAAGAASVAELAPMAAAMTPEQKHDAVGRLCGDGSIRRALFVGDGINDAAAMAASHASIALSSGAPVTLQTASATLHGGNLSVIPDAIALCRNTVAAIRSNFIWAIIYNAVGIAAAAAGWLHPVLAAVLMSVSSAVVAWRSFRVAPVLRETGGRSERVPAADARASIPEPTPARVYGLAHWIGLLGQGVILAFLAGLSVSATIAVLIPFVVAARLLTRRAFAPSAALDMTIAMASLGGLGMNLGWWSDNGFRSIAHSTMHACCMPTPARSIAASPWMYGGMLLLGVPAMYVLRRTPEFFSWRRWCCVGPIVLGIPAMVVGMWAGSYATLLLPQMTPHVFIVIHYLLMLIGMTAGMFIPHALELLFAPGRPAVRSLRR